MTKRRHLVFALHDRSWGRAAIALNVAHSLSRRGDSVHLVLNRAAAPVAHDSGIGYTLVDEYSPSYVTDVVRSFRPTHVIHSDVFSTANFLWRTGVAYEETLGQTSSVSWTVDVWDSDRTGALVDVGAETVNLARAPGAADLMREHSSRTLIPVPFARTEPAAGRFCALPEVRNADAGSRNGKRAYRRVMFCTAPWQTGASSTPMRRLSAGLLELLSLYLSRADSEIRLVHVGPRQSELESFLGRRCSWRGRCRPHELDQMLSDTDLFISANIAATTIPLAMLHRVPVLVIENSFEFRHSHEFDANPRLRLSAEARHILARTLPIWPFRIWPLGYFRFLEPVMEDNPYRHALETVEMFDEDGAIAAIRRLVNPGPTRDDAVGRQAAYLESIRTLPTPGDLIAGASP